MSVRLPARAVAQLLALLPAATKAMAADSPPQPPAPTESVVVTSRKLPVQTFIDRKVYTLTDDLQASFGTLSDVLTDIPSVDVDPDGNLTLRGDSHVLILIDGKPSPLFSGSCCPSPAPGYSRSATCSSRMTTASAAPLEMRIR